jgi:hypothetical protein
MTPPETLTQASNVAAAPRRPVQELDRLIDEYVGLAAQLRKQRLNEPEMQRMREIREAIHLWPTLP